MFNAQPANLIRVVHSPRLKGGGGRNERPHWGFRGMVCQIPAIFDSQELGNIDVLAKIGSLIQLARGLKGDEEWILSPKRLCNFFIHQI